MKSKMILSLVMAAAVTLGGATMATNANFNATAISANNSFTMGTVQLQRGGEQAGQSIQMDQIFNASNMGFDQVKETVSEINIRGSLPVTLAASITSVDLPSDEAYVNGAFQGKLTEYFKTINTDARWWRQYKMAVTAQVIRNNVVVAQSVSRNDVTDGRYDSFFDTLTGAPHKGSAPTAGLSDVLKGLGTLNPGDTVKIITQVKLVSELKDGSGVVIAAHPALTNDEQNIFQGEKIGADVSIIATEAR